ncbi:DNA repair protein REV1 [Ceratobasidium sp. AG-Ba]|nr:DNA repair protein REV1 [Ceratobasidium sp. AG-Ba]QRW15448.1 DNA repair protein REV1 [Ceratobasidium sp. AG-Ba]
MSQTKATNGTSSAPLGKNDSQSSDYFDDDPGFADALAKLDDRALFGSQPLACLDNVSEDLGDSSKPSSQGRKRKRSPSPAAGQENSQEDIPRNEHSSSGHDSSVIESTPKPRFPTFDQGSSITPRSDTYDASKFGGFSDYFRRKRAKLQNQNANLSTQDPDSSQSTIFKSIAVYITGRVNPSLQILRALITQHGGVHHAYLDRKEMVTHVITSGLTPAKAVEFKHMKVVRPEWIVESVAARKLLPWSNYRWVPQSDGSTQSPVPNTPMPSSSIPLPLSSPIHPNSSVKPLDPTSMRKITAPAPTPLLASELHPPANDNSPLQVSPVSVLPVDALEPPAPAPGPLSRTTDPFPAPNLPPKPTTRPRAPSRSRMPPPAAPSGPSKPSYAAHKSNPEAERLMKSAEWREAHTAASGEMYIQGYYQHSRLHHLSKWKAELRDLVAKAQEEAESQVSSNIIGLESLGSRRKDKGKGRANEKVIMHCDFDSFFVSAGLVARPELKDKPVAVCHASGSGASHSTSEIASASYAARAFGVKNGMSLGQARQLCPDIQTIPYEFERYKELSLKFYTILMGLSDDLQAVSVDEALIDVTSAVEALRANAQKSGQLRAESYEKQIAEKIRDRVRASTGCEVSIGIGPNIMLARLATKRAKPAGSFYLSITDAPMHIAELDIVNLHGFAGAVREKAILSFGTSKLGDLANKSKETLRKALGDKSGERIWNAIRGVDDRVLESDKPRKSVSADVNYGIRFENNEHAENFMYGLGREVSDRLKSINKRGRSLTLKIMKRHPDAPKEAPKFMGHGKCETFNRTSSISGPRGSATDDPDLIGREAWKLLQAMAFDPTELRGIGIQIQKLDDASDEPRSAPLGQLAMRFQQVAAKPDTDKRMPPKISVRKSIPLAPQVSIIDVDALDDGQLFKPSPGHKETPFDLTMLSQLDDEQVVSVMNGSRARSLSIPRAGPSVPGSSKAGSLSPRRAQGTKRFSNMGPPTVIPDRSKFYPIFTRQLVPIPDHELVALNIDPIAYAKMTKEEQKALVFTRRAEKGLDGAGRPIYKRRRKLQVPTSTRIYKMVQAVKFELPAIRAAKPGADPVTETGDIQDMMRAWVETKVSKQLGPDPREVAHFSGFLEKSMATDRGMQRTVEVMKWWRHVCMDSWGADEERRGQYGREWWQAWWKIKDSLDAIVKSRFGGKLNLD